MTYSVTPGLVHHACVLPRCGRIVVLLYFIHAPIVAPPSLSASLRDVLSHHSMVCLSTADTVTIAPMSQLTASSGTLRVTNVNVLTTTFTSVADGRKVVMPNSQLINMCIVNLRTSPGAHMYISLKVSVNTPAERISLLEQVCLV